MTLAVSQDWVVEATLDEAGLGWKRREAEWVVPAGPRCPQEIVIVPETDGLRVEATLVAWDDAGEPGALGQFLRRAQGACRPACCELQPGRAVVTARVEMAELEARLAPALAAVAGAIRRLGREAGALLSPDVAEGYCRFFGGDETADPPDRI